MRFQSLAGLIIVLTAALPTFALPVLHEQAIQAEATSSLPLRARQVELPAPLLPLSGIERDTGLIL